MNYLSPEQYCALQALLYPSLYASDSLAECKLKVYNQLFNVIGSGIGSASELRQALRARDFDQDTGFAWTRQSRGFRGYENVREFHGITLPDGMPCATVPREPDKSGFPRAVFWQAFENKPLQAPYPNFHKTYSLAWLAELDEFGPEWIEAAACFYRWCDRFFSHDPRAYHGSFPSASPEADLERIANQNALLQGRSPTQIQADYGVAWRGSTPQFLTDRWTRERSRIQAFIAETLERLEAQHARANATAPSSPFSTHAP